MCQDITNNFEITFSAPRSFLLVISSTTENKLFEASLCITIVCHLKENV